MVLSRKDKKQTVKELKKKLGENKVVAVASIQNLPSKHYNRIRKNLKGKAEVIMTRETLMRRALDEARPELKELQTFLEGSCVLLLSNDNPFHLAKWLRQNRSKTFAKAGQIAPDDIVIPAGETSLPPGPILTELKLAKVNARIQGPKVVISKDSMVAKKGEPISLSVVSILQKLNVEPMEIRMKMRAAFDNGTLYKEDVLDISEEQWISGLTSAHQHALNLSVFAGIMNRYSIELLIQKAAREANAISSLVESKSGRPAGEKKEEEKPAEEKKEESLAEKPVETKEEEKKE
ncbi:50S ribosomal protein L10 [Candidatus Micrarchaeota archaeon]|nr:50S ribosomal protein L10 [Candidatus Micrarchaeota archaeon]